VRQLAKIAVVAILCALAAASARAALLQVNGLVLRADGGFAPRQLPRRSFAPIEFRGWADIRAVGGGVPAALRRAVLDFDRDGRLATRGLARCPVARVLATTPRQARRRCPRAIVGRGRVEALIALPGRAPVRARSALTVFNAPRQGGRPTVVLHAHIAAPVVQTFAIVVPIERRRGRYSHRVAIEMPQIAGGYGALTYAKLRIGRRFRLHGAPRSYVSARCSDGILETHGHFAFAEGTILDGVVEKPCRPL
jgi:hypothetical protein